MARGGARKPGSRTRAEREFVSEVEEILERMRSDLLDLAEQRGQGELDPTLVNRLFRSAHSLKGLSGLFGIGSLGDLAHHAEDVLDRLRMGRARLDDAALELLEESVELFAAGLTGLEAGRPAPEVLAAIAALCARIEGWGVTPASTGDEFARLDLDPGVLQALTEYEEHRLAENLRRGRFVHAIEVSYELHAFDAPLAELSEGVRAVGELLSTLPSPGGGDGSLIRFSLLAATLLDAEALAARLDLPAEAVRVAAVARPKAQPVPDPALRTARAGPVGEVETLKSLGETVRVDIQKLDTLMNLVGELVIQRRALGALTTRVRSDRRQARLADELDRIHQSLEQRLAELQAGVLEVRMVPLRQIFDKLARVVRRLQRDTEKEVRLELRGADTELDKLIVEELADPLVHVVRNAFDHAIESREARRAAGKPEVGTIRIEAHQRGNDVQILVADDGRGIDAAAVECRAIERGILAVGSELSDKERLELVFEPGLSTCDAVSETSGRGVGMDVLRSNVNALGGLVDLTTASGVGTTVSLTLPVTLAIVQALIVGVADRCFAIPLNAVHEILLVADSDVQRSQGREILDVRGEALPLCWLARELGLRETPRDGKREVLVLGIGAARIGVGVDRLIGQQDAVVKPLQGPLGQVRGFAGATELGDGKAVLVIDVASLVEDAQRGREAA